MRNENKIFLGIITKVTANYDSAGTPDYQLYAKIFLKNEGRSFGAEFPVRQMSLIPTKPAGTKGTALPDKGQQVLLFRDDQMDMDYIVGYIEDNQGAVGLYERGLEPGEIKLVTQGLRPTEFSLKPNQIFLDAGGYTNLELSERANSITMQSKKFLHRFHGGFVEHRYNNNDEATLSTFAYVVKKESQVTSDAILTEPEINRPPSYYPEPYVDKVFIRAGRIKDYESNNNLGHVYQLETRQDVDSTGSKNTWTNLKLGYQTSTNPADWPDREGSLVDWSTKRLTSSLYADTSTWRHGYTPAGEMFRFQTATKVIVTSDPLQNPYANGQGYELYDITADNASNSRGLWYSESVNDGTSEYFYRKGLGKYQKLHVYEEISENNFLLWKNIRKDGTKNDFTRKLSQDSYQVSLETENTEYTLKFNENSIEIKMVSGNDEKTTSYMVLDDQKAKISYGEAATVTLTTETCDINTNSAINLTTEGDTAVTSTGNLSVDTTGTTDIVSTGSMTVDGDITFKGSAKMSGIGAPKSSGGAFCGLPACLFTGAPHQTDKVEGNKE